MTHSSDTTAASRGASAGNATDLRAGRDVFFDGQCPVCRAEIGVMRRLDRHERLNFVDIAEEEPPQGHDREAMLKRMHVRRADGEMATGAESFVVMWRALPGLSLVGRALDNRVAIAVLEPLYRGFLRVRKLWRPERDSG